jgi:hypothetical protein
MLLLKLLVAPGLVGAVTLAVRRWGPGIGGWLSGMPVVAGPVLVFLALEQGTEFGAQAAHATLTGLIGTVAFTVVYARTSVRLRWHACLLVGWVAFGATTFVLYLVEPPLVVSLLGLFAASLIGRRLLPEGEAPARPVAGPRGDLALRLVATATLVLVLTGVADRLGPHVSGLLNAFPVLSTIVTAFTHAQHGSGPTIAFVSGFVRGIIGFGSFSFVMALTLVRFGLGWALVFASIAQVVVSGLTLQSSRRAPKKSLVLRAVSGRRLCPFDATGERRPGGPSKGAPRLP